jgi:hypothetical protein
MVSEAGEPLRSLNRLRLAVYAFAVGFVTGEEGGDRNYSSDCLAGWRKWKVLERPQQRPYEDARRGNYSSGFVAKEVATARHPFGRGKQKIRLRRLNGLASTHSDVRSSDRVAQKKGAT